ncbi:hypothetical protein Bca52824_077884 [Brassica carinata]|uniref:Uncharacterized protein n=1 Tax=Brassica carinata TaxID=52824 RepID=A0A8X7PVT8_BRACI|nr:hypothetical protein Bca52824_077884 [Brassica carinata]
MRCKRHTVDLSSSTAGVCASCLRERLLSLAASAAVAEDDNNHHQSRKSNNLIFPRSVSPYVTRRKSDACGGINRRFIATPQVDTGFSCRDFESNRSSTKPKASRRISNLFRASRSDDFDSDTKSRVSCSSSSSSTRSWISSFLSRKQQPATTTTAACYIEDVVSGRRPQRVFCRGMSPARDTEAEEENEPRRTPAMKTPGRRKIAAGIGRSMSGMGFCLSPLVRASPNCPFKRKIRLPSEFNGSVSEVTAAEKPHIAEAASFCANRSKKLVDIGRVNHRR